MPFPSIFFLLLTVNCCQGESAAAQPQAAGWSRLERGGAWKHQQLLLPLPLPLLETSERPRHYQANHSAHPRPGDLPHDGRPHHQQLGSRLNQLGWQVWPETVKHHFGLLKSQISISKTTFAGVEPMWRHLQERKQAPNSTPSEISPPLFSFISNPISVCLLFTTFTRR